MKPLEPEEYSILSPRYSGPLGVETTASTAPSLWALTRSGLMHVVPWGPDGKEYFVITEAGQRAVRIHRAYLASMVTA